MSGKMAEYMAVAERWLAAFNRYTHGTNWYRIAFIFLPAIIRGDIFSSVNLYLPFVFGYLLKRCVQQCSDIFSRTDDVYCNLKVSRKDYITWVWKSAFELALVLIFLLVCHFMKAETRILVNFFIASFVCPLIRAALPQAHRGPLIKGQPLWDETVGELVVQVFIVLGLALSWGYQGMDQLFLGFLFLLAIPAVQDRLWWKPEKHGYLVLVVCALCFPFMAVGITSRFFPSYLTIYPKFYLKVLCWLSNVTPMVKDYYAVLGISHDADGKEIRRVFRKMSLELHPDKVGDDPVAAQRFNEVREASDALTKQRAAYDKAIENVELNDMAPRCEAFMIMMYFWILHSLIDWVQVEDAIIAMKKQLRDYILQDRKLDTNSIGIEPEIECRKVLKQYCEKEDVELPSLPAKAFTTGAREDIERMRELLTSCGAKLAPFIQVEGIVAEVNQEVVLMTQQVFKEHGDIISKTDNHYVGWNLTIDGKDVRTGEPKKTTVKVSGYRAAQRAVTAAVPFGFEAEPGKSKFVLAKDGGRDEIKGVVGFHLYGHENQVMTLGTPVENQKYTWKLSEKPNYYSGYKFELYEGDVFVGWQRVHEYLPKQKRVVLKGPVSLTSKLVPAAGKTSYRMFPDQIIPQNNATPYVNREDPPEE